MTDRDRLIEIIINADTYDSYDCKLCAKGDDACDCCFAEKIADYLLANGVIVPPCSLNQTVWQITWNNRIEQCKVSSLTQKADGSFKIRITPPSKSVFEITPDKIGKAVFLTKEEAEAELRKRGVSNAENN